MPSIRQLQYAIKTIETGSINEAAKQLFVSQPSLSNALKLLEEELGITIFNRGSRGVTSTEAGKEFLVYAQQVLEQVHLLEARYKEKPLPKRLLSVSCQHYAFAVHAFAEFVKCYQDSEYEFTLRETETHNIINDLVRFRSEIGIIYQNDFNQQVLQKVFKENNLVFTPLFNANLHVFIGKDNPLAQKEIITLDDLADYPRLSFEQGNSDSFYFSEEVLSILYSRKSIKVSDRATIFNLMVGINGYTISSGVLSKKLNDANIIAVPLDVPDTMTIGWLKNKHVTLSPLAQEYLQYLKQHIADYGFDIIG